MTGTVLDGNIDVALVRTDGPRLAGFRALVWPDGPRGAMEGAPLALPFHLLLGAVDAHVEPERDRVTAPPTA